MITLVKVKDSLINIYRTLKVLQLGSAKTVDVVAPFGDDSGPTDDMIALYMETSNVSEPVVVGYINKNQIAKKGEKRIFSLKEDGSLSIDVHLLNDGTMKLGGDTHNAVRYSPLEIGINQKDALINTELSKIATALATVGATYVPGNVSSNISLAKIEEIKTL